MVAAQNGNLDMVKCLTDCGGRYTLHVQSECVISNYHVLCEDNIDILNADLNFCNNLWLIYRSCGDIKGWKNCFDVCSHQG
jgi:hypothetical protein